MRAYFDHAASSPLRPAALAAMQEAWQLVGNPAALHTSGRKARARLEDAREELAALLGARPDEVIFTSGGSEADSIALLGAARARPELPIIISAIEHPAVAKIADFHPTVQLAVDQGGQVSYQLGDELTTAGAA